MNPQRLRLRNFRSYGELDLELPHGCLAILGENGAGKSSIPMAIEVALFGGKLSPFYPEQGGDGPLLVELTFGHQDEVYRVRRTFKPGSSTKVDFESLTRWETHALTWEPLTRETTAATQKAIDAVLGFTRRTFRASAFLAQGDGAAFTEAAPRDRKAILADALDLAIWDELLALVRTDARDVEAQRAKLVARVEVARERLAAADQVWREAAELEEEVKVRRVTLEQLVDRSERAAAELEEALLAAAGREAVVEKVERAKADVVRIMREGEDARLRETRRIEETRRELARVDARLAALDRQQDQATEAIAAKAHEAGTFATLRKCPACGQTIDDDATKEAVSSRLAEEGRKLRDMAEGLERERHELEARREELGKEPLAAVVTVDAAAHDEANVALREAQRELDAWGDKIEAERAARKRAEGAAADARHAHEALTFAERKAAVLTERVKSLHRDQEEVEENEKDVETLDERLRLLRLLFDAFGRDGIPALIIESIAVPQIERDANAVLEQLGSSFRVELRTERRQAGGTEALDVVVGGRTYETFSGGERTRLNLALRIALARLLARRGGRCELLAIDEPEFLDEPGLEALGGVLRELPEFDRTLLISHVPGLRDAFDTCLVVEKNGDRSLVTAS